MDEALGQLVAGAFFYGMRSSEYSTVKGTRKSKQITVKDIRFFKLNSELKNMKNPVILFADTVSITFVFQKNK